MEQVQGEDRVGGAPVSAALASQVPRPLKDNHLPGHQERPLPDADKAKPPHNLQGEQSRLAGHSSVPEPGCASLCHEDQLCAGGLGFGLTLTHGICSPLETEMRMLLQASLPSSQDTQWSPHASGLGANTTNWIGTVRPRG